MLAATPPTAPPCFPPLRITGQRPSTPRSVRFSHSRHSASPPPLVQGVEEGRAGPRIYSDWWSGPVSPCAIDGSRRRGEQGFRPRAYWFDSRFGEEAEGLGESREGCRNCGRPGTRGEDVACIESHVEDGPRGERSDFRAGSATHSGFDFGLGVGGGQFFFPYSESEVEDLQGAADLDSGRIGAEERDGWERPRARARNRSVASSAWHSHQGADSECAMAILPLLTCERIGGGQFKIPPEARGRYGSLVKAARSSMEPDPTVSEIDGEIGGDFLSQLWLGEKDKAASPPRVPDQRAAAVGIRSSPWGNQDLGIERCQTTKVSEEIDHNSTNSSLSAAGCLGDADPVTAAIPEQEEMGEGGRGRGRGRGTGRNQQNLPPQEEFQQQSGPPVMYGFPPMNPQFGFPRAPPPWGFPGAYPPFLPPPSFPMNNQWAQPGQSQMPSGGGQHGGNLQQQATGAGGQKIQSGKEKQKKNRNRAGPSNIGEGKEKMNVDFTEYSQAMCYNCGDPGHPQAECKRAKLCFICKSVAHVVGECPVRKRPHQMAKFVGSATAGLGFYHIEVPDMGQNVIGSFKNCGVVYIESGEISKEDLAKEFAVIYKTNWPWQIRPFGRWSYLVKFPPHISVDQVAGYPCFGLSREDITVKVVAWKEDLVKKDNLIEVWVQLSKLLPKWCEWSSLDQITSVFGLLVDVD
ncbi:hypothetical protein ACQJBY_042116 [Aegilops geniculata]